MGKRREVFIAVQDCRWLSKNSAAAAKPKKGNGPPTHAQRGVARFHLGQCAIWDVGKSATTQGRNRAIQQNIAPNDFVKLCNVVA